MELTGTQPRVIDTPLAPLHKSAGANMGVWFGCSLPNDFGDWQREYEFAKQSVALIDKNYLAYFSFTGPDRARYLNAILTNNIKDLNPGQGSISLLLNPQGRILAEIETQAQPDRLLCISHAMIRTQLAETLEKFIIMDDVTLTDETDRYDTLALQGPKTSQLLREVAPEINLDAMPELNFLDVNLGSIPATITKRSFANTPSADIRVERKDLESLWNFLTEKSRSLNGGPVGYSALNAIRLEAGIPWFAYDFSDKQIPHEAGLQDSHISYVKGCYTGQEIVERVRSRGQVNRRRVSLRFSTQQPPAAGTQLTAEGKEVGAITSASPLPSNQNSIGMGYVRKESAASGTELSFTTSEGNGNATVA
ncbi:MAG: aminomethyltransferase family protein [Acidobacteria bacterium]|nr:aminomethyltransferase family protein [Acidobacteriota bacterium]